MGSRRHVLWWVVVTCGVLGVVVLLFAVREAVSTWWYSVPVAYEVIADGAVSPVAEAKNFVIVSAEEWRDLWLYVHGDQVAPLPAIDFSRYVVLALFQGEKPSGGYSLHVSKARSVGGSLIVSVDDISPGQGCSVTESVTTPFTFVVTQKFTGSFATEVARKVIDCTR